MLSRNFARVKGLLSVASSKPSALHPWAQSHRVVINGVYIDDLNTEIVHRYAIQNHRSSSQPLKTVRRKYSNSYSTIFRQVLKAKSEPKGESTKPRSQKGKRVRYPYACLCPLVHSSKPLSNRHPDCSRVSHGDHHLSSFYPCVHH